MRITAYIQFWNAMTLAVRHERKIPLGKRRVPLAAIVGLSCLGFVLLPYSSMLIQAGPGPAYADAVRGAGDSLLRSILYGMTGASALVVVGFFVGYLVHTRYLRLWRAVDSLTVILFAVPSTVLGIGLVILWNRPATSFIYTTPVILLIGFLAQYSVVTSRASVSALSRIPSSMEDAAQICGAGWMRRIATIILPMARRGLIAGWIAYIFCVRDLGISMIAYPPGWDPSRSAH
jgi:iron(III) transport system permease protein